jgi:hypothetical protein
MDDGPPATPEALDTMAPHQMIEIGEIRAVQSVRTMIDEVERLRFARQILVALFLISLVSFGGYYAWPESRASAAVFELVKVGMLPLVTLVIAFYFPNRVR